MKQTELVVKLPIKTINRIKSTYGHDECCGMYDDDRVTIVKAIVNGIFLPKGHGDLVDRDGINSRFNAIWNELENLSNKSSYKELLDKFSMCLDTALTIIEADWEGAEE